MNMKRFFCYVICLITLFNIPYNICFASDMHDGAIYVNNVKLNEESKVMIINNYAYVPMFEVLEALGCKIWQGENNENIYFEYDKINYVCKFDPVIISNNKKLVKSNNEKTVIICKSENIDSSNIRDYFQLHPMSPDGWCHILNGVTYLYVDSAKILFQELSCKVDYDSNTNNLRIFGKGKDICKVFVNNTLLEFDVNPFIENGRLLVPMRYIFEALGAQVEWVDKTQSAIATKDNRKIEITINSREMLINGEYIFLDTTAILSDNRTFVPIRAISEGLGAKVEWDNELYTVIINTQ